MSGNLDPRRTSLDTQASGLNSVLSFSGFSHHFPAPPTSVPASPVSGLFPRTPVSQTGNSSRLREGSITAYDWHEGASSIDVDATEHSLLSTSFITGLLRDADPAATTRTSHRASLASDFSEMTYPPPRTQPSTRLPPSQRPQGARPPPSSFNPIPEAAVPLSDDETDYTYFDEGRPGAHSRGTNADSSSKVGSSAPSYGMKGVADYTPFSPALPSATGSRQRILAQAAAPPEARVSMHSNRSRRSVVPSFISASSRSIRKAFVWRKKPLPPIPKIPHIPLADEAEFKQKEESTSLSQLLLRSDALRNALDSGQHPHNSLLSKSPAFFHEAEQSPSFRRSPKPGKPAAYWNQIPSSTPVPTTNENASLIKRRRLFLIMLLFTIVALGAVGAAIGVTVHNRNSKPKTVACSGNLAGAACNLDATCVCTSPVANRCDGLAQNLVNLTPTMNQLFGTNYTANDVFLWIWTSQGTLATKNCASQAVLVDVGATSALTNFANRTLWAQSALLWDLQSLNNTALREFVLNAPWEILTVDGPVHESNASFFSTTASGYNFDFAAQTITVPPVSFTTDGAPTSAQAAQVASTAPLDRMYSFAAASAAQYKGLLSSYWVTNLQRTLDKLPLFMSSLRNAPIMIPFDIESSSVRSLLSSSTFPVPIACYPGLTTTQLQQINKIESVFGLNSVASVAPKFDPSCFSTRPTYGILDILRLRLPFPDSRTKVARQAVSLHADVGPRAIIYSGEVLSALPGSSNTTAVSVDPASYGTLNHLEHVILKYLSGMDTLIANAIVDFVLSNSTVPPSATSILGSTTVPLLEVAVFGTISKADLNLVASGLADSGGSLVFGASDGLALRQWAIPTVGNLIWTEFSGSSSIVHDTTTSAPFNQTWAAAAGALADGKVVGVSNITNAFMSTGLFTSS
ncbi:hypothetical protein MIND_00493700 [Mycena indigotica]|uniref:Uncharacterized protein n=1 Tax=Mycena indigotica TaxID=2126181 RepID=A0A8H6W9V2_9AGAR|nr:uncharacterized protein MIND_00493700 [Mycena indigotica]KAF7307008.1 hypothetical protein MIND_00493700 [Mycena indigotica]